MSKTLRCAIPCLIGILLGALIGKALNLRTELGLEVWLLRDNLILQGNFFGELVENCKAEEYKIFSSVTHAQFEYYGKKVNSITKFPYFGSKETKSMLENELLRFYEGAKKLDEKIEKCKNT